HDRPAELLPVQIHPPRVVHVVALLRERLHQPDVLVEPVALLVVDAVAEPAVVVAAVAQEDADRLLLARQHALGVDMPTSQVDEAAHVAEYLPEMVRALPGDREGGNRPRTRPANPVHLRVL